MTVAFWILNILLALAFGAAGAFKLSRPRAALAEANMEWVNDFSDSAVKTIGALEVLGALGLILPRLLGIAPVLAPIAAAGLAALMIGAVVVHLRRKEAFAPALILAIASVASALIGIAVL